MEQVTIGSNQVEKVNPWWDAEKVRNDKAFQETRMPESMADARTALEAMKFEIGSADPSLLIPRPESRESSITALPTTSPRSM